LIHKREDWTAEEPRDSSEVLCKYCRITFQAPHADIKKDSAMLSVNIIAQSSRKSDDVSMAEARQCLYASEHCTGCCMFVFISQRHAEHLFQTAKLLLIYTFTVQNVLFPHFEAELRNERIAE